MLFGRVPFAYRDRYPRKLTGQSPHNGKLLGMIGRHIGAGNKFVFMNGKGRIAICNEEQGMKLVRN